VAIVIVITLAMILTGTDSGPGPLLDPIADQRPITFRGTVLPILTKSGCNGGNCHGKASGQNGFRLSLLGSDPRFDYESLVRDGRGRRVFPGAPGSSLMVLKPTAQIPHGGGRRFAPDSFQSRTIQRWIAQGMPFESPSEPRLTHLTIEPSRGIVPPSGRQQLRVAAHFDNGEVVDVTRWAQYQSNLPELALVDEQGLVQTARDGVGEAAIMARYQGMVGVARVAVPLAEKVAGSEFPRSQNLIDPFIFGRLRELGIPPSPACTDAEFARRSALDICGILPDPESVAALERDPDPHKRARWVDRLLDRPEYADLFAMKWSALLRNQRRFGPLSQRGTFAFHAWIREALAENLPYDRFVAELLTAQGDPATCPPVLWYRQEATVEAQADDAAQLFLGVRIQCARCHHHPSERWGQDDYYGFAAFFSRIGRKPSGDPVSPRIFVLAQGRAHDPASGREYSPKVLGGPQVSDADPRHDLRRDLVDWLRRKSNPYFARAVVNRYWKHFLGRGLVEPEDDLRISNPPTHPELLDALTADFVAHGYDLKRLVRTIATSRAYDRSSLPRGGNARDRQSFARFLPRRIPAEVLLDAVGTVTGTRESFPGVPRSTRAVQLPDEGFASYFLDIFGRPRRESVCECERSAEANLSQSLYLLNSAEIQRQLADPQGRAARSANKNAPDASTIENLYRIALGRAPTPEERAVCLDYFARHQSAGHIRTAYEDLIWTLINTKEFLFNH
jgi:hypothetical protein